MSGSVGERSDVSGIRRRDTALGRDLEMLTCRNGTQPHHERAGGGVATGKLLDGAMMRSQEAGDVIHRPAAGAQHVYSATGARRIDERGGGRKDVFGADADESSGIDRTNSSDRGTHSHEAGDGAARDAGEHGDHSPGDGSLRHEPSDVGSEDLCRHPGVHV